MATDPTPPIDGWWHNELKSEMEISFDPATKTITGRYRTNSGSTPGSFYPLFGTVNGDVLSITVNWGEPEDAGGNAYESITSWVGQVIPANDGDGEVIRTFWLLQGNSPDDSGEGPGNIWDDLRLGSDVFSPGRAPQD